MLKKDDESLSEQFKKLDELVNWFEQDDFDIEEALQKFEESSEIANLIKTKLSTLENKITVLKKSFDS